MPDRLSGHPSHPDNQRGQADSLGTQTDCLNHQTGFSQLNWRQGSLTDGLDTHRNFVRFNIRFNGTSGVRNVKCAVAELPVVYFDLLGCLHLWLH